MLSNIHPPSYLMSLQRSQAPAQPKEQIQRQLRLLMNGLKMKFHDLLQLHNASQLLWNFSLYFPYYHCLYLLDCSIFCHHLNFFLSKVKIYNLYY